MSVWNKSDMRGWPFIKLLSLKGSIFMASRILEKKELRCFRNNQAKKKKNIMFGDEADGHFMYTYDDWKK